MSYLALPAQPIELTQKVSVCGKLSPKLHSLRYCITQEIEEIEGDLLKACTSLGLQSNHKAQSGIKLGCLLLGADQLTYGGQKKSPRNNFVKYWASKRFVNDVEQLKAKKKN